MPLPLCGRREPPRPFLDSPRTGQCGAAVPIDIVCVGKHGSASHPWASKGSSLTAMLIWHTQESHPQIHDSRVETIDRRRSSILRPRCERRTGQTTHTRSMPRPSRLGTAVRRSRQAAEPCRLVGRAAAIRVCTGPLWLFAIYAIAMGGLFPVATVIYLVIEAFGKTVWRRPPDRRRGPSDLLAERPIELHFSPDAPDHPPLALFSECGTIRLPRGKSALKSRDPRRWPSGTINSSLFHDRPGGLRAPFSFRPLPNPWLGRYHSLSRRSAYAVSVQEFSCNRAPRRYHREFHGPGCWRSSIGRATVL